MDTKDGIGRGSSEDLRDSRSQATAPAGKAAFTELRTLFAPLMDNADESSPPARSLCRPSPEQVKKMWQKIQAKLPSA